MGYDASDALVVEVFDQCQGESRFERSSKETTSLRKYESFANKKNAQEVFEMKRCKQDMDKETRARRKALSDVSDGEESSPEVKPCGHNIKVNDGSSTREPSPMGS